MISDRYGRRIRDLRVSVTDRCNFKCFYCKSATLLNYKNRTEILSFEEIRRLVRLFLSLGVEKVRVTGGEPLLRNGLDALIGDLSRLGIKDLALTTNAFNLRSKAGLLKESGLNRVTVSLDSLRPDRFQAITRNPDFAGVMEGIVEAQRCGLEPLKVNCVLVRGINDDEILDFAAFARERDLTVRFIEFMPLDEDEEWSRERMVSGAEILEVLRSRYRLVPRGRAEASDTASDFVFADGPGRIGLILPVSEPFCGNCSRVRLTADGKIRTCLFSMVEHDIKELMRSGANDEALLGFIRRTIGQKEERHRINDPDFVPPSRSMSYIGG